MTPTPIATQDLQIFNGDLAIDAYLAHPQPPGTYPGIVVIQEIFGVNSHIRSIVERLAGEGYVAIAPAIYQRTAPGFAVGYDADSVTVGREHKNQTKAAELLGDIQSAIAYLQTLPMVQQGQVGTIGFCFGGHVVYLAATLPEVAATASFYGAGIAVMTPGGGEPTLTRTADIHGAIYCFFGNSDPLIPHEHIEQIANQLQQCQVEHQIFRYANVGHGFVCDQRSDYNESAAEQAWQQVLQLFKSRLASKLSN